MTGPGPSTPGPQERLAERIRAVLAGRGVDHAVQREKRMFGGLCFLVDEQLVVSAGRDGDLLVRVDPADGDEHAQRGARPATMGAARRPMGAGWLTVPADRLTDPEELAHWVDVGIAGRRSGQ